MQNTGRPRVSVPVGLWGVNAATFLKWARDTRLLIRPAAALFPGFVDRLTAPAEPGGGADSEERALSGPSDFG